MALKLFQLCDIISIIFDCYAENW